MLVAIRVIVPFAGGLGVGVLFGQSMETAVFIGAALTATSVGITARVFGDLHAWAIRPRHASCSVRAVADDVLGLVILTVVVKIVTGGSVGPGDDRTFGIALLFLLVTGVVGIIGIPRVLDVVHRKALCLPPSPSPRPSSNSIGFAELAYVSKLAFIIGAFMAGLGLGRSHHHERVAVTSGRWGTSSSPFSSPRSVSTPSWTRCSSRRSLAWPACCASWR